MVHNVRIELVYFTGCPHVDMARSNLIRALELSGQALELPGQTLELPGQASERPGQALELPDRALDHSGYEGQWQEWDLLGADAPERVRDFGSPTVLINGIDVTGEGGCGAALACRREGAPTPETIKRALEKAQHLGEA